ncbi:MAG TPA: fluoride efflux transporter CrcB [Bacteroidia bacterium]
MLSKLMLVFVGGGAGSLLRFGISLAMANVSRTVFPLATLLSNFLSCLVLGLVVFFLGEKFNTEVSLRLLLITGFCGGFSTFSAFSYETLELFRSGNVGYAFANIAVSIVVCFGMMFFLIRNAN